MEAIVQCCDAAAADVVTMVTVAIELQLQVNWVLCFSPLTGFLTLNQIRIRPRYN